MSEFCGAKVYQSSSIGAKQLEELMPNYFPPYFSTETVKLYYGNCLSVLPCLPPASVDSVVTDPPYPGIWRPYGKMTEGEWTEMMYQVVGEIRRVLKPTGSAVFILQPNSERVGRMRSWAWKFQVWLCENWNIVQDAYWWNYTAVPTEHCNRKVGLMRPSVKLCLWAGPSNCYRNQEAVLLLQLNSESVSKKASRIRSVSRRNDLVENHPSGHRIRMGIMADTPNSRNGATPFNCLPISNTNSVSSGGALGHGAATPLALCDWWVEYLTPPGGKVLDPFCGSGTVGEAALTSSFQFVGIESEERYVSMSETRLSKLPQCF